MRKVIKDKCECGEPTLVELDSAQSFLVQITTINIGLSNGNN